MPSSASQSSQKTDTNNTQSQASNPWAPTVNYLTDILPNLSAAFNTATSNGANAPTNFVAGPSGDLSNIWNKMVAAGGSFLPGAATQFNQGTAANNTGLNTAGSGITGLLGFNPTNLDTSSIINAAKGISSGFDIPSMVRNALQGGIETARDVTNPGIDAAAAGSGNVNNSRAGLAQGIVDRGLAEQATNLTGTLESQAYGQGLNTASSNAQSQNNSILSALSNAVQGGTNLFNSGTSALSGGINNAINALGLASEGGQGQTSGTQAGLSNQLQQYLFGQSSPFSAISQYLPFLTGIAGLGGQVNGTSSGSSTTTTNPSLMSTIGGLLAAGGSILGGSGPFGATGLGGIQGLSKLLGGGGGGPGMSSGYMSQPGGLG